MEDRTVLGIGEQLLGFLSVSGLFITVALTHTGGLQATGDTRSPFYISLVSQIAVSLGPSAPSSRPQEGSSRGTSGRRSSWDA